MTIVNSRITVITNDGAVNFIINHSIHGICVRPIVCSKSDRSLANLRQLRLVLQMLIIEMVDSASDIYTLQCHCKPSLNLMTAVRAEELIMRKYGGAKHIVQPKGLVFSGDFI